MATVLIKDATGAPVPVEKPSAPGRVAAASSKPVTLSDEDFAALQGPTGAGEAHIGEVGGNSAVLSGAFQRPATTTSYDVGDLVANHLSAASVAPIVCPVARKPAGSGVIIGIQLSKSSAGLSNASFRVHLYRLAPTSSAADNEAFAGATNGVTSQYMGYVDVVMDVAFSDGAKGVVSINPKAFVAGGGVQTIYALIEARAAYAPTASETFTLALEALRD